jgi:hypothetical protein
VGKGVCDGLGQSTYAAATASQQTSGVHQTNVDQRLDAPPGPGPSTANAAGGNSQPASPSGAPGTNCGASAGVTLYLEQEQQAHIACK